MQSVNGYFDDVQGSPRLSGASFLVVTKGMLLGQGLRTSLLEACPQAAETFVVDGLSAALECLSRENIALVFCELASDCPVASEEFLSLMEGVHPLPVVAVSDRSDTKLMSIALGCGAQDCIGLSELSNEDIRRVVRHAIERQALHISLEENLHELEKTRTQFQSLITDNADALVIVDHSLMVRFANPAAEKLLERSLADLMDSPFEFELDVGSPVESSLERRDGRTVAISIRYMETLWNGERAYIATLRDITERKIIEEALTTAKTRAEEMSNLKSLFLANMSHELRTPLNSILGFSELMTLELHGHLGNDRYKGYVDNISTAGHHLLSLINDLLDLSKVESGQLDLANETVDLTELITSVVEVLGPRVQAADLAFESDLPLEAFAIRADARKIKQILFNLLSNAIKFTPAGGCVRAGFAFNLEGGIDLFVSDNGIGIPPDQIPKALSAFGQVDNPYSRKSGEGTGLGLTLSKKFAELHGGSLEIKSGRGEGTTVLVSLPKERILSSVNLPRFCASASRQC